MTGNQIQPGSVTYLITSSNAAGGAERQVRDLAIAMRRRGWAVDAISMLPVDDAFDGLPELGIRVASLEMRRGVPDPRALVRLRRLLRTWRPDVLHAHMIHANLLGRLARPRNHVPVMISTRHNQYEGPRWRDVAYRLTDPLGDLTTTVSTLATAEAIRLGVAPAARIRTVPNGVDLAAHRATSAGRAATRRALALSADPAEHFCWLAAGRLTDAKDYPTLLAAFRTLVRGRPNARLLIAGTGELEGELRRRVAADPQLASTVRLLGRRDDVPALMSAADGFVLSSAWEGLPLVLLEASASALPIVATDVGGSRDAVEDGRTGYLAPPRDPAQLGAAMDRLMVQPAAVRTAMGEKGRARVQQIFEMSAIAEGWERIYVQQAQIRPAAGSNDSAPTVARAPASVHR